jgi:uncharacterized membrane-anchored protein YhcB (DUF1043 family)
VNDETTVIIVAVSCLIIGALLGYFLLGRLKPGQQSRTAIEKQFSDIQKQQRDYQQQVNHHFDHTAELLNDLAESYRSVHNHIAEGAKTLHSSGISPLQPLPEGRPVLDNQSSSNSPSQQPLDYAPREPGSKGPLHEEFGLEKSEREKHPEPPVAPHA